MKILKLWVTKGGVMSRICREFGSLACGVILNTSTRLCSYTPEGGPRYHHRVRMRQMPSLIQRSGILREVPKRRKWWSNAGWMQAWHRRCRACIDPAFGILGFVHGDSVTSTTNSCGNDWIGGLGNQCSSPPPPNQVLSKCWQLLRPASTSQSGQARAGRTTGSGSGVLMILMNLCGCLWLS